MNFLQGNGKGFKSGKKNLVKKSLRDLKVVIKQKNWLTSAWEADFFFTGLPPLCIFLMSSFVILMALNTSSMCRCKIRRKKKIGKSFFFKIPRDIYRKVQKVYLSLLSPTNSSLSCSKGQGKLLGNVFKLVYSSFNRPQIVCLISKNFHWGHVEQKINKWVTCVFFSQKHDHQHFLVYHFTLQISSVFFFCCSSWHITVGQRHLVQVCTHVARTNWAISRAYLFFDWTHVIPKIPTKKKSR